MIEFAFHFFAVGLCLGYFAVTWWDYRRRKHESKLERDR